MWVRHLPDVDPGEARVGYAIGRRVGGAVVRNRLRRRVRAVLAELDRTDQIPPGAYLVGAEPEAVQMTFAELRDSLHRAIGQLREESR